MKKSFFTLLFLGFYFLSFSQSEPKVGDQLVINKSSTYNYVKFPKLNILTKRGKVANYKSVYGNLVVVDEVITTTDGSTYMILKKKTVLSFLDI
ncbi:hypothetical protein [Winogradskyella sp. PG-2]|uniref:hypothetical protein n=1 Tax=Winogradskyella sp. PG-2 TaxID=754409 RepID=UPI0005EEC73A|nr:hypothetical protein [Winogradskyella sp. PG-2]